MFAVVTIGVKHQLPLNSLAVMFDLKYIRQPSPLCGNSIVVTFMAGCSWLESHA